MNHNLLISAASETSSRPPSPLSDIESETSRQLALRPGDAEEDLGVPTGFESDFLTRSDCVVLDTEFNMVAPSNVQVPYPRDQLRRQLWTEEQRGYASQAQVTYDLTDFADTVSTDL